MCIFFIANKYPEAFGNHRQWWLPPVTVSSPGVNTGLECIMSRCQGRHAAWQNVILSMQWRVWGHRLLVRPQFLRGQAIKAGPDITLTAPLDSRLRLPSTVSTCHYMQQKRIHLLKSFKLIFSPEGRFSQKPRAKIFHWGRTFKNFLQMSLGVIHDRIKQMQITRKSVKQDDLHRKQEKLSQGKVRHVYL